MTSCNGCIVANALTPGALCVPCVEASAREAISVRLAEQAITIFNLKEENDRLRGTLADIAESDCWYGDGCPVFGSKHGRCTFCVAREALGSTPSVSQAEEKAR